MKHFLLHILASLLVFNHTVAQETSVTTNQMIVYGTATIEKPADRAQITLSLKGFGPTLETAINETKKKVRDVTAKLFSLGLKESNLYTSSFNSGDNFEGKAFWSSSRDFRTQIDMVVTVDSLDLLEPVVSVLANASPERLSNIIFSLRSDSLQKLEVRGLAIANAQQKATLMAGQLGIALGKVLFVEELFSPSDGDFSVQQPLSPLYNRMMATSVVVMAQSGGAAFFGHKFSVKSGVRVVFEIRSGK
ncbi:MAG: SIMPL domain-containing protein [Ignavibacteriales bacterium]|nr:SIMPL domain-containing protein [Ignavibacteriales bacterium]